MNYSTIIYETDDETCVATLTINRPDAMNAFTQTMCEEFRHAWQTIKNDDNVHAVVIRAAKGRAFSTGGDFKGRVAHVFAQQSLVKRRPR